MSISFNHPKNTVTSTESLNLIVTGGNPSTPQPIRFSSTSVVMPVRALPAGEAGAMVFDTGTKTMKYHNGLSWVELLGQDTILAPIYNQLNIINQALGTKVDNVVYNVGAVPLASISGTQLSITFPQNSGGGGAANGLFTSSKKGALQHYALQSGMNASAIREQMSGASNGQAGRNGTQGAPWITNDGWAFADGMWWTWLGESGTITQQVPNLNQQAYLKPMDVSGTTQIGSVIVSSAVISGTALSVGQLPSHQFTVSGQTATGGAHSHGMSDLWSARMSIDNVRVGVFREGYSGYPSGSTTVNGDHFHTFTGTSNILGKNETHTHSMNNLDVSHFNVAVLYNIATPSFALNEAAANGKYVLKSGDVMTGSLTIATAAVIRGDDNNITFSLRNNSNAERAMIYHSNTNNTLRFRANGGTEMTLTQAGALSVGSGLTVSAGATIGNALSVGAGLTVGTGITAKTLSISDNTATVAGKNIVRSVNGTSADSNGNVAMSVSAVQGMRFGALQSFRKRNGTESIEGGVMTAWADFGDSNYWVYLRPLQYLLDGNWITVAYTNS